MALESAKHIPTPLIETQPIPCLLTPPKSKLIEIDYRRDIYPYLGHEIHCIFCMARNKRPDHGLITKEHIVPKEAKKMYPDSLGLLVDSRWNHLKICAPSHAVIDAGEKGKGLAGKGGKIHTLRNYGLTGLVDFLARYPRAIDPVYNYRQQVQFINLFGFLAERVELQLEISRQKLIFAKDQFLERFDENILNQVLAEQLDKETATINDFTEAWEHIDFYMGEWKKGNFSNTHLQVA